MKEKVCNCDNNFNEERLKYTIYMACAMEHATEKQAKDWKSQVKEELSSDFIGLYDPVDQESEKTGADFIETGKYLYGLKRAGNPKFHEKMNEIWWGRTSPRIGNKIKMLEQFRDRSSIDGNYKSQFPKWGDFEAVSRSSFIIAYIEKGVHTVGTHHEILTAYFLDIPVYLILVGGSRSETNSTLVNKVEQSGGENGKIFYTVHDCLKHIKEKYNLDNLLKKKSDINVHNMDVKEVQQGDK